MYAKVAVPRSTTEALTYSVPEALRPMVQPGVRVRVPLRRQTVTGLVVAVEDHTDLDGAVVRDLHEVLDPDPLLPTHQLDLALFIATYYRAPVGDTLACMLPTRLLRRDAEEVEITPEGAAGDGAGLSPAADAILSSLRSQGRQLTTRVLAVGGEAARAELLRLEAAGLIRRRHRRRDRPPGTEVQAVTLSGQPIEELLQRCGRAPSQRRVVQWLAERGRPALVAEVCAEVGCSPGVVRALIRKGVTNSFSQQRARPSRWTLRDQRTDITLTDEQTAAVRTVCDAVGRGGFTPLLLAGVTGSGKTEVYLRGLEAALARGRGGIVLVPEIGLTPAAAGAVERRFGDRAALLHSAQSDGDRWREWSAIREGAAAVVVGPRSALFAPLQAPGLIVVDEEHDAAYKQQEAPRYHARDIALVLGQRLDVPVLMCSATPSAEAAAMVARGKAHLLRLTRRVAGGTLPEVELVDLRGEAPEPGEHGHTLFSRRLLELVREVVGRGEQIILLMHRRGWAPVLLCRDCGARLECPSCSVPLVLHRRAGGLHCHYCGFRRSQPQTCPACSGSLLDAVGAGTEKVAHRLQRHFPDLSLAILDRDTVRRRNGLEETLGAFASGRARVLIGTQMVAKGHHFPNVTLTGVISADALLGLPDFRAGERTFQLLTQVAGRAGRGTRPGRVVIQTYHPDHPAVRHASGHDVDAFLAEELRFREAFGYPPVQRMASVRFEGRSQDAVRSASEAAASAAGPEPSVRVRGPAPAPLQRLRGMWRWQLLISAPNRAVLREVLERVETAPLATSVRRVVDVDPLSTL